MNIIYFANFKYILTIMNNKYRDIDKNREIKTLIKRCISTERTLTLWQVDDYGQRIIWNSLIVTLDKDGDFFICKTVNTDPTNIYDLPSFTRPIYLAGLKTQDLCFKCSLLNYKTGRMKLSLPYLVKAIENREIPRRAIPFKENKRCTISTEGYLDKENIMDIRVVDISSDGLGTIFTVHHLAKLKVGKKINIKSIDGQEMSFLTGEVVYIKKMKAMIKGTPTDLYRCGIKLNNQISSKLLNDGLYF